VEIRYADVNLVEIPEAMSFEDAAVLGCRFGTAFRALLDQAGLMAGQWLAVFGCGGVGLASILIAQALGARVIAVDPRAEARKLAAVMGADHVFARIHKDALMEIQQITEEGVDITLDAIGSRDVLASAMQLLIRRGRHIQVGLLTPGASGSSVPLERIVAHELELYGSHGIQAHRYESMLRFIQERNIPIKELITHQVGLEEAVDLLINLPQSELGGVTIIRPWS
jgi:alcohol dehydrogenase